ncbi:SGNH/GDSL hydrolase family protein [Kordia antarctica]|nr:hypothetical protein [Kordia antarctica]
MKKQHRLFLIQVAIALVIFLGTSFAVKSIFLKDPKAQSYLSFNDGIKNMASNTYSLIDSLIAQNDLTFDPTSGKMLDKVLNNLKYSEKPKFLIIGSSQMRVMQGEDIQDSYQKMVSRKMAQFTGDKYATYNLSLGGMSTPEKFIMSEKGVEIINPDRILIAVTPWDGLAEVIRPEVKAIVNKTYKKVENKLEKNGNDEAVTNAVSDEVFPLNINSKITTAVDKIVEDNIDIYQKRSAIKKWLNAETIGVLKEIRDVNSEKTEDVFRTNTPAYWKTFNQDLDNIEGWESEIAHTGSKSIKIVNEKAQSAKWTGDDILLKKPTDTFDFEGWSKAENVQNSKLYCIDFQVIFEDGTSKWFYKGLTFNTGTHDWELVKTRIQFDKKVTSIKPHVLFYGGTGTVWFDEIKAMPVYNGVASENLLPNAGFEEELTERVNVSYSYTTAEWVRIQQNMFLVVDQLAKLKTKEQNVFLLTPFWHNNEKTAYPQRAQYKDLVEAVKKYCVQNNVAFVDASYILSKDNFGLYTNGEKKGKIDVLHFNAEGHEKLAKYIIKELNL